MVSILKGIAGAMQSFSHDGFEFAFIDQQPAPAAEEPAEEPDETPESAAPASAPPAGS